MTRQRLSLIVSFIFAFGVGASCAGPNASNANNAVDPTNRPANELSNRGNDSVEELRSVLPIAFDPEEVTWRTSESGGKKRLVAILLLTPETHRAMTTKYGSDGADVHVNVERWFPVELVTMAETSGNMTISGKAFPAAEFHQDPYSAGTMVFIPETNYLILDMQSG